MTEITSRYDFVCKYQQVLAKEEFEKAKEIFAEIGIDIENKSYFKVLQEVQDKYEEIYMKG